MEIKGYKAFNPDKTNRYGIPFEEGKTYSVDGPIRFGNTGNGYHMCTKLCDVFRYFDYDDNNEVMIAEVIGNGKHMKYDDEYYGYYDMYSVEKIKIVRFLTREEIISNMLNSNEYETLKFLRTFKLNKDEILLFYNKYKDDYRILMALLYHQMDCLNVYERNINPKELAKKKILGLK